MSTLLILGAFFAMAIMLFHSLKTSKKLKITTTELLASVEMLRASGAYKLFARGDGDVPKLTHFVQLEDCNCGNGCEKCDYTTKVVSLEKI